MTDETARTDFDVLIIGAGISGIGAGCHLTSRAPGRSFAILEGRDAIGGTWDLFRFPGIRSDSDLFTFGFGFKPWISNRSIAASDLILDYLHETIDEYGLEPHFKFGHHVTGARWSSDDARWTVTARRTDGETVEFTCGFLYCGTGYYDYENPFTPQFEGADEFTGTVVHPQFWPEDLDYGGKRVVVIGSGATAATIIPAMAETTASLTMLQRSPSYMLALPAEDPLHNLSKRLLGPGRAYRLTRRRYVFVQRAIFRLCQRYPRLMRRVIMADAKRRLPKGYAVEKHFNPAYDPWDQRMCIVPDGDLYEAVAGGKASIVTDRIDRFTAEGIRLASGELLEADIIVTATGLNIIPFGRMTLTVDGADVDLPETTVYKSMMLAGVPNFAFAIGYVNASWTLKVDLVCDHMVRLLDHMDRTGADMVVPVRPDGPMERLPLLDLNSGYVQRGVHRFPHAGGHGPWTAVHAYERDVERLRDGPVDGPDLRFRTRVSAPIAA